MTNAERLKRYDEEIAAEAAKARKHEAKKKALMKDRANYERKHRTHRLCTRAAMLEHHLRQPLALTDEQVNQFLKEIFALPAVQDKLNAVLLPSPCEESVQEVEQETQEQPEEPSPKPRAKPPNRSNENRPPSSPYQQNNPFRGRGGKKH